MPALPALTKVYSVRANAPFNANSTAMLITQSLVFNLKQHLKDTLATGTLGGVRHANSIWTVKSSSNGITMGALNDGIDRWTTHTDLLFAAAGANHSWIVMENATLGYQICIDCVPAVGTSIGFAATEIAFPFTGGSITNRPLSAGAIGEFCAGTTSTGVNATFTFISDQALGNFNWTHFVTSTDGQFYFLASRTGFGAFTTFLSMQRSINARGSDTRNVFLMGHSLGGTRGAPSYAALAQAATGCTSRNANGTSNITFGMQQSGSFGGSAHPGAVGIDAITGNFLAFPLHLTAGNATQPAYRGELADIYSVGTAAIGASIPTTGSQERIIAGDFIIPFPTVNPIV